MNPYPGFEGDYFSMPCRNVVPKPFQQPHPPLWVACTSRDTLKLAARLGIGALTFAFMDAREAKFWVEEYYEIFRNEAVPLGRAVNPNVAMLGGLMCHEDGQEARRRGMEGQAFFKWALAHYYRFGVHSPGKTDLWKSFLSAEHEPMAGTIGVGSPDEVRRHFEDLEAAGLDQVILLHQAANYKHENIMHSLDLFARNVLPDFIERDKLSQSQKEIALEPYIRQALDRMPAAPQLDQIPAVQAYPKLWEEAGVEADKIMPKRTVEGAAIWKMSVAGLSRKDS
jgi:alkanesulfonate monooxygenase SsuD/methylene tetrahydromethanopterin reductase-like flavin-dependent oxidoreductase (luciferase family)